MLTAILVLMIIAIFASYSYWEGVPVIDVYSLLTDDQEGTDSDHEYGLGETLSVFSDYAPEFNFNIDPKRIPGLGNGQQYIAIHYLGVNGENNSLETNGEGTHFYIYWDGTIYQAAGLDAITWHVGTGGYYTQIHPDAGNDNTIGIEMCAKCDGDASNDTDPSWYFTEETQESCLLLTAYLMKAMNISEENVIRHGDIVDKWCPAPYFNNNRYQTSWTWDEFKSKLRTVYRETDVNFPVQWES